MGEGRGQEGSVSLQIGVPVLAPMVRSRICPGITELSVSEERQCIAGLACEGAGNSVQTCHFQPWPALLAASTHVAPDAHLRASSEVTIPASHCSL